MRLGIDIGGTFTDFVFYDEREGVLERQKILSDPVRPGAPVLEELNSFEDRSSLELVHGSTVATNALLERSGARTAFITTRGFRDLLTIGRQNRTQLYDLASNRPAPLIPPELCFEVEERINQAGEIVCELPKKEVVRVLSELERAGAESICLCLLFSFLNPTHENRLASALRAAGFPVSASHEILPEFREFERASTTAINAYVAPVMQAYLGELEPLLPAKSFRVMQSNGGSLRVRQAMQSPVRTILSGPAGGVVGALRIAQEAGFSQVITMDMGGTSTDVCITTGEIPITSETVMDGLPIRVPMIDIHSIGAGGGSIAELDPGGALRVGPHSAGANPGPACYGLGGQALTVTDANLILGRLIPDYYHGGRIELDLAAAEAAASTVRAGYPVSASSSLTPNEQVAQGVIQVVHANMLRALRVISVERGHDSRDFTLVSFGGAGGLHACELAREMGIRRVLIPETASVLSALGMLAAEVVKDYVRTVMLRCPASYKDLAQAFEPLIAQARQALGEQGFPPERLDLRQTLDLRYQGQSFELSLPFTSKYEEDFHRKHQEVYGYQFPDRGIEIVNLRLHGTGPIPAPPSRARYSSSAALPPQRDRRSVILLDPRTGVPTREEILLLQREALGADEQIAGPAILLQPDTTVLLPASTAAQMDSYGNLLIEVDV